MPIELILSPLMRPVVRAKALLFHPHRRSSRYVANIIDLDKTQAKQYVVLKQFGSGSKVFDVYDTDNGKYSIGPQDPSKRLFWFKRSRAVKGAYKMFSSFTTQTEKDEVREPVAVMRAGLRSNILLIRSPDAPVAELGWHVINHRVDANDSYRMFSLADGFTYQWTYLGKWLERITNVGEKESEVRERIGQVIPHGDKGFTIFIDESKIVREIAICSGLCSYIDQWNTNLEVGGIYYARDKTHVRWKRD